MMVNELYRITAIWLFSMVAGLVLLIVAPAASAQDDNLLPIEEAFSFKAEIAENGINARWTIADGYYMYREKLSFSLSKETGEAIPIEYDYPVGKTKSDPSFGVVEVYTQHADFLIPVRSDGRQVVLSVSGQGCNEPVGVCYPPINLEIPLTLVGSGKGGNTAFVEQDQGGSIILEPANNLWWIILTALVAGVGLTFTPCVLPLIPILSSVIAGQGEQLTKTKAVGLSGTYVLGTAVTYAGIGAVAGATGEQLQAYFQNVWAIGTMAAVFFIMALSMFGLFTIQMPSFVQSRLTSQSQRIKGGSVPMVFALGLMSALIVGACVSPILISFLGVAIAQGSASLGAITMFSMAVGMGLPLVLLAVGLGHLLPKAGMWMDNVKNVFGVMLLGVTIYMLSVLPAFPVLYLWASLFIVVGIYLGATQSLPERGTGWQKLLKGFGTLILLWGGVALVGALYGGRDILHPLPDRLMTSSTGALSQNTAVHESIFASVNSMAELEEQLKKAQQASKMVMIDYYADWCVDCIRMENTTFSNQVVREKLDNKFVALQIDVTDPKNFQTKAMKQRFRIFGPPAVLFIDQNGHQLQDKSFYGYKDPENFLSHLRSLSDEPKI